MKFFVRFAWLISLLGFLYNLFTTYGNVQQILLLKFGEVGFALSRAQYFFFFLGFFCVLNILLFILGKMVPGIPAKFLFVPFSGWWTANRERRGMANRILSNWTWIIAATANYFMMYWMLVVEIDFHFEGSTISSVTWFYKPGYIMLASLLLPWLRFFLRNVDLLAQSERE